MSYQWRKGCTDIPGATGPTLDFAPAVVADTGNYSVRVTSPYGAVTSAEAFLEVVVGQGPAITTHPVAASVTVGGTAAFTVAATGLPAPGFQWHKDNVLLAGETASTLTIANAQVANAGSYHVVVSTPFMTTHPSSATIASGASRTLSVVSSGTGPLSYQWYRGSGGNMTQPVGTNATYNTGSLTTATSYWVRVSNAFGSLHLALTNIQPTDAGDYRVVVTNNLGSVTINNTAAGDAGTYSVVITNAFGIVVSPGALLTVNVPPGITTHPQPQQLAVGATAIFSVTGTAPLSYRWRKGGDDLPGQTAASLTLASVGLADEGIYSVVVTNAFGLAASNNASLQVNSPPVFTATPGSGNRAVGTGHLGCNAQRGKRLGLRAGAGRHLSDRSGPDRPGAAARPRRPRSRRHAVAGRNPRHAVRPAENASCKSTCRPRRKP